MPNAYFLDHDKMSFIEICRNLIIGSLMFISCSLTAASLQTEAPPDGNLTRIKLALERIFRQTEEYIPPGETVYFVISSENSASQRYLESAFQEFLSGLDKDIVLVSDDFLMNPSATDLSGSVVSLEARSIKVEYKSGESTGKSSGKKLSRNITVQVFCNVVHKPENKVVFARTLLENLNDTIAVNDIDKLQETELSFSRAEISDTGQKNRKRELLEVTSVLSAVGIIIYLLFSTRG